MGIRAGIRTGIRAVFKTLRAGISKDVKLAISKIALEPSRKGEKTTANYLTYCKLYIFTNARS